MAEVFSQKLRTKKYLDIEIEKEFVERNLLMLVRKRLEMPAPYKKVAPSLNHYNYRYHIFDVVVDSRIRSLNCGE